MFTGHGFLSKLAQFLLIVSGVGCLCFFAILPLPWQQQTVLGLVLLLVAFWIGRSSRSYVVTLTLMLMSMFATIRYGWWRISTVVRFFQDPSVHWGPLDAFFVTVLIFAETYAFVILFLGYFQTIWPLRRVPVPLPEQPSDWPDVDLVIPTFNEPLNVVRNTVLAALNIDWPVDKLKIYILDDGDREEFRRFAHQAGVGYVARTDNKGAKAGNINHALAMLHAPFVVIFDSDHVPTRSFLQVTMGWLLRDQKLGMLQTPHHFYSPDPFERNLSQFRVIPNEGELFYGVVQDGNDFWNAAFFCGSCAVLRRSALDQIGGIATDTVTEDAHTSLRMQRKGWNTAYINIPQAAGLATESLSGHVKQRVRWARGMMQILRMENPLLVKGLTLPQRLCYFNAMAHFMYALPRLIFLTAPLIYLVFSRTNVPGYWAAIAAYAIPHLVLSNVTNSRVQGQHRHSFWNEIYETVLAPYILLPTLLAFLNPKRGQFNVTAKGGLVKSAFFDSRIAQPFLVLLLFNVVGLLLAIPRFFWWDTAHPGTVVMNVVWSLFNIVMLGVAVAVCHETQQRRSNVRIDQNTPAAVLRLDGTRIAGETVDVSGGGAAIQFSAEVDIRKGEVVRLLFSTGSGPVELPGTVVGNDENTLRFQFNPLTIAEQERLATVMYSRADAWLGWGESREIDRPLRSLYRILRISMHGLRQAAGRFVGRGPKASQSLAEDKVPDGKAVGGTPIVPAKEDLIHAGRTGLTLLVVLLACASGALASGVAPGQASGVRGHAPASSATLAGSFRQSFTLASLGAPRAIELRGIEGSHTIYFSLPQTHVVRQATLHLLYHVSPSLIPELSQVKVILNGTLFATLPVPKNLTSGDTLLEQTAVVPAVLLAAGNQLTFEFTGHYTQSCEDPANTALWAKIDPRSTLALEGSLLPLADDLKMLPVPFVEPGSIVVSPVAMVFLSPPSKRALQAAGIVASYFGMVAGDRALSFSVSVSALPKGNAVVIAQDAIALPASLKIGHPALPTVALRTNPVDPYGKLLVITGGTADQLVIAAQALALRSPLLEGATASIRAFDLPLAQLADQAPRWGPADQKFPLWHTAEVESIEGDGSAPLDTYLRLPPDLYFGDRTSVPLSLNYRYNSIPIGNLSSIKVRLNNALAGSVLLVPGKESSQAIAETIPVPVAYLRPFSNSIAFDFAFQPLKRMECDTTPTNMRGAILRDSYLDLRGVPHWAALPNLELFANAGFPFTRFADLSQTSVIIPATPAATEIQLYLALMGHFGAQTGYPVLRLTVDDADALSAGADRDFLIIGSAASQSVPAAIAAYLPVRMVESGLRAQPAIGLLNILRRAWWKMTGGAGNSLQLAEAGQPNVVPNAVVEAIESPFAAGRSIVLIVGRDAPSFDPFASAFLSDSQSSAISGSVSVFDGARFRSYRAGGDVYHVGTLPLWTWCVLWFGRFPWVVALLVPGLCFVLAVWTRVWLRRRARVRLQIQESGVGQS